MKRNPLIEKLREIGSKTPVPQPHDAMLALREVMELPTIAQRRTALKEWPSLEKTSPSETEASLKSREWEFFLLAFNEQEKRQPKSHEMDLLREEFARRSREWGWAFIQWLEKGEEHFSQIAQDGLKAYRKRGGKVPEFPCSFEKAVRLITQEPEAPWSELQAVLDELDRQTLERFERGAVFSEKPEFAQPEVIEDTEHFGELSAALWPLCRKGQQEIREKEKKQQEKKERRAEGRAKSIEALEKNRAKAANTTNQIKERKRMDSVIAAYASYCEGRRRLGLEYDQTVSIPEPFPKVHGVSKKRARGLIGSFITALKNPSVRDDLWRLLEEGDWPHCTEQDVNDCFRIFLEIIRR
jgi:hypothetical protein